MASHTTAVQKEIATTVRLSPYFMFERICGVAILDDRVFGGCESEGKCEKVSYFDWGWNRRRRKSGE